MTNNAGLLQTKEFCEEYGLRVPILLAPMAGACPASLSIAVASAGGMGAAGVLTMSAEAIADWVREMRRGSNGPFQLNTRIPDPAPVRDFDKEAAWRSFLAEWGPAVSETAAETPPPDFEEQLEAMLSAGPQVISSHMGLFPDDFVRRMKAMRIRWFASVTTVTEAVAAEAAGADAIVAQGMEAGGHRGCFSPDDGESGMVGLVSLVPAVVDAVGIPVIATGGIADSRGIAAALMLGASAVQIGTGFLCAPEAQIATAWAEGIQRTRPEETVLTRAFSGRAARSLPTAYAVATSAPNAPGPMQYPIQNNLTLAMRTTAARNGVLDGMAAWAGQSAGLARALPAGEIVTQLWDETHARLTSEKFDRW